MLSAIAFLALANAPALVSLPATESVWVYAHAGDPAGDELLRVWGAGGLATPEGNGDGDDWSYAYVKWNLASLPPGTPKSAVLTVYNVNPAGFGDVNSVVPLEARALIGTFTGKNWDYSFSINTRPDLKKTVFGFATPKPWGASKKPIPIVIDLMKGPGDFRAYLATASARPNHELDLALTSSIDPNTSGGGGGKGGVYKFFSAAAKNPALRPTLKLEY
ncbi:MAG: hypothetical protein ACYC96_06075 [Fimbriimonadaceae bacterium]